MSPYIEESTFLKSLKMSRLYDWLLGGAVMNGFPKKRYVNWLTQRLRSSMDSLLKDIEEMKEDMNSRALTQDLNLWRLLRQQLTAY